MDKEIDVKLFVTCRLCIEEVGQYQILPNVQEQFKYCFNINVEPFDGLPQLICQKCKEILNNFYTLKKLYSTKQADLINKCKKGTYVQCMPQHDVVSSSQRTENVEIKKNSAPRSNYSSESSDTFHKSKRRKKKKISKSQITWDSIGFKKEFVCTICDKVWPDKCAFGQHQKQHANFLTKHSTIFKNTCSVVLKKLDGKPNITGLSNTIVHNNNKIIENCNSLFYIKYYKDVKVTVDNNASDSTVTENYYKVDPESTDTEDELVSRPKHSKRRRLLSRSSNETVVPETNSMSDNEITHTLLPRRRDAVPDDQCINIEDSSDSDADRCQTRSTSKVKKPVEAKLDDYKIIQGIISMCVKTYYKKMESVEKSASQLKPKILSIGRKIISKPGFNWTGLLRYMEHKNLNIVWAPKAITNNNSKDSNYIRFMTKQLNADTAFDNLGWMPIEGTSDEVLDIESEQELCTNQTASSIVQNINKNVQSALDSAVLLHCSQLDSKNKLLNANPVANPKQLPRKSIQANELRLNKSAVEPDLSFYNNEDANLCMPIITSTTSLAVPNVKDQQQDSNTGLGATVTPGIAAPRIKVKPVSELMSESTLNSLRNEISSGAVPSNMLQNQTEDVSNILHTNTSDNTNNLMINSNPISWNGALSNVYSPNIHIPLMPIVSQPMQLVSFVPQTTSYQPLTVYAGPPTLDTTDKDKDEYIILDSVKLPNTKTASPFQYLRNLFLMHNLFLIEQEDHLTRDFVCLIKFKVKFQQESIDNPLVLCLSLFCFKNKFCFTVKDKNQVVISISKVKPNWQWEILNVFRGEPVEKLLQQNAQKHSKETHDHTNKFICLLKSVTRN